MIKLLIVDDHPVVRKGVKEILAEEPDLEVSETDEAEAATKMIKENPFDLVVLDLDLPGRNGIDLLKDIKLERPQLPVLVLSIHPEEQFAVRVLKAGAAGYVSKDVAPDDLVKAIRKVLRGGKHISERVAEALLSHINLKADVQVHEKLSDREFQILCMLGTGKTVSGIAQELSLSVPTVSTYRSRILEKTGMKTTAELIRYAIQHRLVNPGM